MEAIIRALAAPHRRRILRLVRDRELPAGSISERFHITRPAVSQHLSVLKQAGLVVERRDGTRRLYRTRPQSLMGLRAFLEDLQSPRPAGLERGPASSERISVERELVVAAKPEAVWELLVSPEAATRWMGRDASFDLHVGGGYRVEVLPGLVAAGEFLEIEQPSRLVHTWGWELEGEGPVPPGSTVVAYELLDGREETRLRLCHRDLPSLETAGSHSRGWAHYLARLAAVASGHVPGPDPWVTDPERMRRELRPASGASSTPQSTKRETE
jgi:uncharacterized protein YndB with AHSA1/START domain/biotin operon repressor